MKTLCAISCATVLAACAPIGGDAADQAAIVEARAVGEPVDCIETSRIDYTRVRSNQVVDFYMDGTDVFRNTLPTACEGLNFRDDFTYTSTNGRICSIDRITVRNPGGVPGPTCGIGAFQPIETDAI